MIRPHRAVISALAGMFAVLVMAGCGLGAGDRSARIDALADLVPDRVAADGHIMIGLDVSYPPYEFTDTDGRTVIGLDVDLAEAIGRKLGLAVQLQHTAFADVVPGVRDGRYELGMSSLSVSQERRAVVDMVSYLRTGNALATARGNPDAVALDNLCGRRVAVQSGTSQAADLRERSRSCGEAGRPTISVVELALQTDVALVLTARQVSAMLADGPVVSYLVAATAGDVEAVGPEYAEGYTGIAVAKGNGELARAVLGAVQAMIDSGEYADILHKWHVSDSAVPAAELIN